MSDTEINSIVRSVLQHDLDPPSEDYSPYDHGISEAQRLPQESVGRLIAECLRTLPCSLAGSFVEGVLQGAASPDLEELLIDTIPQVREVSSASLVAEILTGKRGVIPAELALRLLARICDSTNPDEQNRFAYALYALPRSTWEGSTLGGSIRNVISSTVLTDYARETLESCSRRSK